MKSRVLVSTVVVFGLLLTGVAFAQEAAPVVESLATDPILVETPVPANGDTEEATALSKLVNEVMNVLVPAFVTFIGLLVTFILNWVRKKFKLNVSDHQISSWSVVAEKSAHRAAEWARNKAKQSADGQKIPGPDVLEVAVDWAVEMGKAFKLPEIGREKLIGLIESNLHVKRGSDI